MEPGLLFFFSTGINYWMGPPFERWRSVAEKKWLHSMVYDRYNL